MNYQRIHDAIINRARNRTLQGYYEKHHVIPRCIDVKSKEIVNLTAREHFIIHKLLCEIYPGNHKLIHAYWLMANKAQSGNQQRDYNVSSKEYQKLKEQIRDIKSVTMKGNTFSKGNIPWNKNKSVGLFGDDNPAKRLEVRKKISDALTGRQLEKKQCPYCNKKGWPSNMYRWHFDYCKLNPDKIIRPDLETCNKCGIITTKTNIIRWHNSNCKTLKSLNNSI
jgi:hypothetical protein